ncbi:MAG: hypothetical protein ACFFAN_17070 [Promethearchaeota archaeon]
MSFSVIALKSTPSGKRMYWKGNSGDNNFFRRRNIAYIEALAKYKEIRNLLMSRVK